MCRRFLRAAIEAPTAGNMTLWSAIRVTDEAKKKRLSETCDNQPFIASAPLVLVFCADSRSVRHDLFATLDLGEELRKPGEGDLMLAMMDTIIAAHASVVAAATRWAAARATSATSSSAANSSGKSSACRSTSSRSAWWFMAFRRSFKRRARSPRALKRMISYLKTNIRSRDPRADAAYARKPSG